MICRGSIGTSKVVRQNQERNDALSIIIFDKLPVIFSRFADLQESFSGFQTRASNCSDLVSEHSGSCGTIDTLDIV